MTKVSLTQILYTARKYGASDIHLLAGLPPAWRINGDIVLAEAEPFSPDELRLLAEKPLNEAQLKNLHQDMSLCYSQTVPGLGRFRVSIYLRNGSPELAIRLCSTEIKTREELGIPAEIDDLLERPSGLILITGATGTGKTTTLNYMIDQINSRRRCKIITIEDPIEYVHPHKQSLIVQQELYTDVVSFEAGLIHILRQDPDVIGIGEMRNYDTIATALTAAETGHLVIATLHTSSVVNTIERIVGVFPPSQQPQIVLQLANTLQGVMTQQLLPTVGNNGRALAYEFLLVDLACRNIIRENEPHKLYTQIETGSKRGMCTMDSSLSTLYERGIIGYDTLLTRCIHPDNVRQRYNRKNV